MFVGVFGNSGGSRPPQRRPIISTHILGTVLYGFIYFIFIKKKINSQVRKAHVLTIS